MTGKTSCKYFKDTRSYLILIRRTSPGTNWFCDEQGRNLANNMAAPIGTFQNQIKQVGFFKKEARRGQHH